MIGRKYFNLTLDELREHPIWVLAMNVTSADDEAWDDDTSLVVPLPADPHIKRRLFRNFNLYVRTSFIAAGGRTFLGLIKLSEDARVEYDSPSIVTESGRVEFYHTIIQPSASVLGVAYDRLRTSADELFPLRYKPDTPVPYGSSGGVLQGFYYLKLRGRDQEIKYVR